MGGACVFRFVVAIRGEDALKALVRLQVQLRGVVCVFPLIGNYRLTCQGAGRREKVWNRRFHERGNVRADNKYIPPNY